MQTVDNISKLLDVDRDYVYSVEIPRIRAEVYARNQNLKQSRYRAEKFNEIDIHTKEDYYGMKAVTTLLQGLFGGENKDDGPKGARNIRDR